PPGDRLPRAVAAGGGVDGGAAHARDRGARAHDRDRALGPARIQPSLAHGHAPLAGRLRLGAGLAARGARRGARGNSGAPLARIGGGPADRARGRASRSGRAARRQPHAALAPGRLARGQLACLAVACGRGVFGAPVPSGRVLRPRRPGAAGERAVAQPGRGSARAPLDGPARGPRAARVEARRGGHAARGAGFARMGAVARLERDQHGGARGRDPRAPPLTFALPGRLGPWAADQLSGLVPLLLPLAALAAAGLIRRAHARAGETQPWLEAAVVALTLVPLAVVVAWPALLLPARAAL